MRRNERGITLIELMVVVAIVALIAGIAVPSYRQYVLRTQRTDATAALLRMAAAQEKFYLQNNTYASTAAALGIPATEHGWYTLSMPVGNETRFRAQASAAVGSPQFRDTECRTFTITETGVRGAVKAGGGSNTERCWR